MDTGGVMSTTSWLAHTFEILKWVGIVLLGAVVLFFVAFLLFQIVTWIIYAWSSVRGFVDCRMGNHRWFAPPEEWGGDGVIRCARCRRIKDAPTGGTQTVDAP
jgi:hypothetical protein